MLIPIGHENASARRWPIVTIAIIVINVAVFVVLHGAMEEEGQRLAEVKLHLLMLAAMHPQLDIPPERRTTSPLFGNTIRNNGDEWKARFATWKMPGMCAFG